MSISVLQFAFQLPNMKFNFNPQEPWLIGLSLNNTKSEIICYDKVTRGTIITSRAMGIALQSVYILIFPLGNTKSI